MRVAAALFAMTALAHAQLAPCDECARGNALLDALGGAGQALRANLAVIAEAERIQIEQEPLSANQAQRLTTWKRKLSPEMKDAIDALAGKTEQERLDIGFALCNGHEINCARHTALALRCATGVCDVEAPEIDGEIRRPHDVHQCDPRVLHTRSAKVGAGFEVGSGWHMRSVPVETRLWSLGLEMRYRWTNRLGVVARFDAARSRDEPVDDDGDGKDDLGTGAMTRLSALAGPSFVLDVVEDRNLPRFVQLDLLAGASTTAGFSAGADLSYQLVFARVGLRYVENFRDERALLAHIGFLIGSRPEFEVSTGICGGAPSAPPSPWALGLELPLSGYSLEGYVAPGFALEAARHVSRRVDILLHADLLAFTRGGKDRALHHTALGGGRFDFSKRKPRQNVGYFITAMGGFAHVAAPTSSTIRSGLVGDLSVGYGGQGRDGAGYIRLHARFGLTPDNFDLFAVFLAIGTELRLHGDSWRDRREPD